MASKSNQHSCLLSALFFAGFILLGPFSAEAASIQVISQSRSISATAQAGQEVETASQDTDEAGRFDAILSVSAGTADGPNFADTVTILESNIRDTTVDVRIETRTVPQPRGDAVAAALTKLDFVFELTGHGQFSILGAVGGQGESFVSGVSLGPDGEDPFFLLTDNIGSDELNIVRIDETGTIPAGIYRFSAFSEGCAAQGETCPGTFGYSVVNIDFSVIPEPATLTLLSIGIVGLARLQGFRTALKVGRMKQ